MKLILIVYILLFIVAKDSIDSLRVITYNIVKEIKKYESTTNEKFKWNEELYMIQLYSDCVLFFNFRIN